MSSVRNAFWAAIIFMSVAGCSADSATSDKPVGIIGEAEFGADTTLQGRFEDVLVTWLEPANQPQPAGDTGNAGEDRLPIVVAQDETRIFSMEDANRAPNTMQLLDTNGAVLAETGAGQQPAMVRLKAGTYTIVIRRAASVPDSESMMAIVMPLQRVSAAADNAVQASSDNGQVAGADSPVSYIVNPQITDAITLANVKVLGDAPAMAMGNIYQSMAHALGIAAANATSAQQQGQQILNGMVSTAIASALVP